MQVAGWLCDLREALIRAAPGPKAHGLAVKARGPGGWRVRLEDTLRLPDGSRAPGNAELVRAMTGDLHRTLSG